MNTVKFSTLGCKVNQYDTQVMRERFTEAGLSVLDNCHPADIYVINTCTVTHRADADSLSLIRKAKRENPQARIIVTGCLTELDEDKIKQVDSQSIIVKNSNKETILRYLFDGSANRRINEPTRKGISCFHGHTRAFLKIQDGCNHFCSFCKVPLVRGRSRSKSLDSIIQEAQRLIKNGYKEIVLTGICLGAYGRDLNPKTHLVEAIEALKKIEGLVRIRLSSIEVADISAELIQKMAYSEKLCPHLHIPLQSGDDQILRSMNRTYQRQDYLELIKRIRALIPGIAITTDVLVGFPGEQEGNFRNTLEVITEIMPLKVHIFPYSERKGTASYGNSQDKVGPFIIKDRVLRLKNLAQSCAIRYKEQFLSREADVLIEDRSKENSSFWEGYTDNYMKILIQSNQNLNNRLIHVKLTKIVADVLLGRIM